MAINVFPYTPSLPSTTGSDRAVKLWHSRKNAGGREDSPHFSKHYLVGWVADVRAGKQKDLRHPMRNNERRQTCKYRNWGQLVVVLGR